MGLSPPISGAAPDLAGVPLSAPAAQQVTCGSAFFKGHPTSDAFLSISDCDPTGLSHPVSERVQVTPPGSFTVLLGAR